jgi:hypothetical protein
LATVPIARRCPQCKSLPRRNTSRSETELIEAIGDSTFEATAVSFMTDIAENEPLRELRHEAIEQLSDMSANTRSPRSCRCMTRHVTMRPERRFSKPWVTPMSNLRGISLPPSHSAALRQAPQARHRASWRQRGP